MRSKASFKSHPIHPMLIAFPVAFLVGTFAFDLISLALSNDELWHIAYYLEITGIGTALIAAIPGIVDYSLTIPPNSSAKKRAAKHGLINVSHLALFFIAWRLRSDETILKGWIITIESAGVILLSIAGWLGGTLVFRNQIGVDHRYANAGKWNEVHLKGEGPIAVATSNELELNQMKLLHINGKRIVLGRSEKGFVAFDDHCTHRGGSLADGAMVCGTVQCPWHGSQFDVTTGEAVCGPARKNITTYTVTEKNGKLFIEA